MRLLPPISSVELADGPFTVFVVVDDLQHYGVLSYDDNRDTVPDREVDSVGLAAFEFTIAYDPTLIAVEDVRSSTSTLERTGREFQCLDPRPEPGRFSFGCISTGPEPPGPQGTMTLASVVLRPLGSGSSALMLDAQLAGPLGSAPATEIYGGVVQVRGGPAPADPFVPTITATATQRWGETPGATDRTPVSTSTAAAVVERQPQGSPDGQPGRLPVAETAEASTGSEAGGGSEASRGWLSRQLFWGVVAAGAAAVFSIGAAAAVMARKR